MYLKDKNRGNYSFFYKNPKTGDEVEIGPIDSFRRLVQSVYGEFANQNIEAPENLEQIIEHQICLRSTNPKDQCWSGGLGDDIHLFVGKIDDAIEKKAPSAVKKAYQTTAQTITKLTGKKSHKRLSSCSGCGGTVVYDTRIGRANLGRAGRLNAVPSFIPRD